MDATDCAGEDLNSTSRHSANSVVSSELLNRGFSTSDIQAFIDIINNPTFDKATFTLKSYSDVFAVKAAVCVGEASRRFSCKPFLHEFPPLVIANIIDIIESGRLSTLQGSESSVIASVQQMDEVWMELANTSLVHPSWTWLSQKAMGRHVCISKIHPTTKLRRALSSVHLGPWTKRAFIMTTPELDEDIEESAFGNWNRDEQNTETARLLVELFKRLPNLERVSLQLFWRGSNYDEMYSRVYGQISTLKRIRKLLALGISSVEDSNTEVLLARLVLALPSLETLTIIPGSGRCLLRDKPRIGSLIDLVPPRHIMDLTLTINQDLSSEFMNWVFGASQLRSLDLTITSFSLSTMDVVGPRNNLSPLVDAVKQNSSLSSLTTLCITFNSSYGLLESSMIDILTLCTSLQILRFGGECKMITAGILRALPSSLVQFQFSGTSGSGFPHLMFYDRCQAFEAMFVSWLNSPTFRSSHSDLRAITFSLGYVVEHTPDTRTEGASTHSEEPLFEARILEELCRSIGIGFIFSWVQHVIRPEPWGIVYNFDQLFPLTDWGDPLEWTW